MKSEIVGFMTSNQIFELLLRLEKGSTLSDWILEGLQDRGYINHRDQLTEAGRKLLADKRGAS